MIDAGAGAEGITSATNAKSELAMTMERTGIEPVTPSLQSWCSPS
jgi:hypothetical protein